MTPLAHNVVRAIRQAIEQALKEKHMGLPAKVVSYDRTKRTADVQVTLKRGVFDADGEVQVESYPQIPNVPVLYPAGGGWSIRFPLRAGDTVYLSFCDRALDEWKSAQEGDEVDPVESRSHDLKDAIAIPGRFHPNASGPSVDEDTLTIGNDDGSTEIQLRPNGMSFIADAIDRGNSNEAMVLGTTLLQKLQQLEAALISHFHPASPSPTGVSAQLATPVFIGSNQILSQKETVE